MATRFVVIRKAAFECECKLYEGNKKRRSLNVNTEVVKKLNSAKYGNNCRDALSEVSRKLSSPRESNWSQIRRITFSSPGQSRTISTLSFGLLYNRPTLLKRGKKLYQ
jgi:hypothetical protein